MAKAKSRIGVLIQQLFPLGAFGPRFWSLSEMRRLYHWLKQLGYEQLVFMPWSIFRREDQEHTLLERGALYHAGLSGPPDFEPGFAYGLHDRYLQGASGPVRAEHFRQQIRLARQMGLEPWLALLTTQGSPQFAQEHPHLAAISDSDTFNEGTILCPSQDEAMEHLLSFHAEQIRYFDGVRGYLLWPRDPGGCFCAACADQGKMLVGVVGKFHAMIRSIHPEVPIGFVSWHITPKEVEELAAHLPADIFILEAPRLHALDVPREEFIQRVKSWKNSRRSVEAWLEIQENPTTLLPSVYPRRIDAMIETMRDDLELEGIWATSTQNPYLFPLHFWLMPKLWQRENAREQLLDMYLEKSYGADSVSAGRDYIEQTERGWELMQSRQQYEAGFLGLFVVTSPFRMLPEKLIQQGVSETLRRQLEQGSAQARRAGEAAESFADQIRHFHPMQANIIAASAEVFYYRVQMRWSKLEVLDALHRGEAAAAARGWEAVQKACEQMIEAARNAPNTDVLLRHWRRLELLPGRLKALRDHLRELAQQKAFRPVKQPLYWKELYPDQQKDSHTSLREN